MKKIILPANLSVNQIRRLKNQLEKIEYAYEKGCRDFIEYATMRFYALVMTNCDMVGIEKHSANIKMEYDAEKHIGRVYTSDMVIIFNEFGTGIKGIQDEWASKHNYQVNVSGKGDEGWWYPSNDSDPNPYKWTTPDGEIRALTHGLESRHMFYDAFIQLQSELSEIVEITIGKALGDLY